MSEVRAATLTSFLFFVTISSPPSAKHITVDSDKVQIRVERGDVVSLLEIDIEIPKLTQRMLERRIPPFHGGQTYQT